MLVRKFCYLIFILFFSSLSIAAELIEIEIEENDKEKAKQNVKQLSVALNTFCFTLTQISSSHTAIDANVYLVKNNIFGDTFHSVWRQANP